MSKSPRPRWNVERIVADMASRGWNKTNLARAADKNFRTIDRFLTGEIQTPRTLKAIAIALGHSPDRYFLGVHVDDAEQSAERKVS